MKYTNVNAWVLSSKQWFSFDIKGGEAEAFKFLNHLRLIQTYSGLGSTESLAEHPATMTHCDVSKEDRDRLSISEKLIRLSIGLNSMI